MSTTITSRATEGDEELEINCNTMIFNLFSLYDNYEGGT